jgi:protease-4
MTEQPPSQPYQPPRTAPPPTYQSPPTAPPPTAPPPTYHPPPRRAPLWQWGCGFGLAGCLLAVMLGIFLMLLAIVAAVGGVSTLEGAGDHVALIRVEGLIVAGQSGFSFLGGTATGSDDVVDQLDQAIESDDAKAILVRINSPGGSAAGAQEICDAILRAKEAKKPIVVSMADVAASGGYYVAAPADVIFAAPATVTGSIGVIAVHEDLSGLLDKLGIEEEVIKSGELKDMFNPTEPLSPEAREVVTALVEQVFGQFVDAVAQGRGMAEHDVLPLADGRIYTGQQAVENGLIDKLGGLHEALMEAGGLGGIEGKPEMRDYGAPSFLRWLFGAGSAEQRSVTVTGGLLYDGFAARLASGGLWPKDAESPALEPGGM